MNPLREGRQCVWTGEDIQVKKGDILIPLEPVGADQWIVWNKATKKVLVLPVDQIFYRK